MNHHFIIWKKPLLYALTAMLMISCQQEEKTADAYGNFEADQVTVSAQNTGKIVYLNLTEGAELAEGQVVGLIDTLQLHYKIQQLRAQSEAIKSRRPGIYAQIAVLEEQKDNATTELERFRRMYDEGAATEKQVSDLEDQVNVLAKQINQVRTQNAPIVNELQSVEAQIRQLEIQIEDAIIKSPVKGRVLLKIMEPKEFTPAGNPLFVVADLDTLVLRAFLTGSLLDDIQLGQEVEVWIDKDGESFHKIPGTISWIASEAEFTPKIIQTRDERVDLVYAVKIQVPNRDGILKIGMPGEVHLINN